MKLIENRVSKSNELKNKEIKKVNIINLNKDLFLNFKSKNKKNWKYYIELLFYRQAPHVIRGKVLWMENYKNLNSQSIDLSKKAMMIESCLSINTFPGVGVKKRQKEL